MLQPAMVPARRLEVLPGRGRVPRLPLALGRLHLAGGEQPFGALLLLARPVPLLPGNPLLLLGYLLLATLALNALAAGRQLRSLRVRRTVEGPVFAGTPCPVEVQVENRGTAAARGVTLRATVVGSPAYIFLHKGYKSC